MDVPWTFVISALPVASLVAVLLPWRLARIRIPGTPLLRAAGIDTVVVWHDALRGEGLIIERIDGDDPGLVLAAAASVDGLPEPLDLAIRCACLDRAIAPSRGIVQDTRRFTHRGSDGLDLSVDPADILVADADRLRALGIEPLAEPAGRMAMQVAWHGKAIGLLLLRAAEREGAAEALATLAPRRIVLATPEAEVPARRTAERFAIDEALARCAAQRLPEQVQAVRANGSRVAVVGVACTGADLELLAVDDLRETLRPLAVARLWWRVTGLNLLAAAAYHAAALGFAIQSGLDAQTALIGCGLTLVLIAVNSARLIRA